MRSLLKAARRSFAFFNKKKVPQQPETMEEIIDNSKNLGYLIEKIKERNRSRPKLLPPKFGDKLTVVFEMDECFMYSFTPDEEGYLLSPFRKHDHYVEYPEYDAYLSIYRRKNCERFLQYVVEECEPVLWTTSVRSYCELVMPYFDPENRITNRLTQEHCDTIEYEEEDVDEFLKDLQLLGRDMRRVVSIDSRPFGYWMYPDNCIALPTFKADATTADTDDMQAVIDELEKMRKLEDVRPYLSDRFLLREILQSAKLL